MSILSLHFSAHEKASIMEETLKHQVNINRTAMISKMEILMSLHLGPFTAS